MKWDGLSPLGGRTTVNLNTISLAIGGILVVFYFFMILNFSRHCPKLSDPIEDWVMWLMLTGISCLCVIGGVALMGKALENMGEFYKYRFIQKLI